MAREYGNLESFRMLLLPIQEGQEEGALRLAIEKASELSILEQDFSYFLISESEKWKEEGRASREIIDIVKAALSINTRRQNRLLTEKYFDLHNALITQFFMTHDQASAFLSHSQLAIKLAVEFKVASSQIANWLQSRDKRVPFCRSSIQKVLSTLRVRFDITEEQVSSIFVSDARRSERFYADADIDGCILILQEMALRLGLNVDFGNNFKDLIHTDDSTRYIPYIQILHYQCIIAGTYDIDIKDLYEFSPRGVAARTLFNKYPSSIAAAGNPLLNNAKSVEQITESWVRSKKPPQRPGAKALYNILDGLQSLGFPAKKEFCEAIRLWIQKVIVELASNPVGIPSSLNENQMEQLKRFIAVENTGTSGVMEQRMVDVIASAIHVDRVRWRPRGLLDAVNTTNISQKKLGDCDFQDAENKVVIAYEAHGGTLTQIYLTEHLRTLRKILPYRKSEWESFSDIEGWSVQVVFVAHHLSDGISPIRDRINGIDIEIDFTLFTEFFDQASDLDISTDVTNYFLRPLSERRVSESVRVKLIEVME